MKLKYFLIDMQMNQVRDCSVCGRGPFFPNGELKLGHAANTFGNMSVSLSIYSPASFHLCESVTSYLLYPSTFPFPLPAFSFLYPSLPLLCLSFPLLSLSCMETNLFILRLCNVRLKRAAIAKNNLKFILDTKVSF